MKKEDIDVAKMVKGKELTKKNDKYAIEGVTADELDALYNERVI